MQTKISISAMSLSDLPFVVGIERKSQLEPWSRKAFLEELANRVSVCLVARLPGGCRGGFHGRPRRIGRLPWGRIPEQEARRFHRSPRWISTPWSFRSPGGVIRRSPGVGARRNMRRGACCRRVQSRCRVMGYICFWVVADELHILNIAVHRMCRRRGVGRVLLLSAIQEGLVRGVRKALLEVRSSNLDARGFYQSLGFRVVGERPGYYGRNGEPAILMDLILENTAYDRS